VQLLFSTGSTSRVTYISQIEDFKQFAGRAELVKSSASSHILFIETEPAPILPTQSIPFVFQIQTFDFASCPRRPSLEMETGLDARVIIKASDNDDLPQLLPAMMPYQLGKHHFQRDAVKRIVRLRFSMSWPYQWIILYSKDAFIGGPLLWR
jgi:hypothetical protein